MWTGSGQDLEVRLMEFPSGWEAGDEGHRRIKWNSCVLDWDSWVSVDTFLQWDYRTVAKP